MQRPAPRRGRILVSLLALLFAVGVVPLLWTSYKLVSRSREILELDQKTSQLDKARSLSQQVAVYVSSLRSQITAIARTLEVDMPPGGFAGQPPEVQAIQLDNARTMLPLWAADLAGVTCEMLGTLDKPTLIVHGTDSNAYWPHIAETMRECLPRAEVTAQPNVNHDGPVRDPAGLAAIIKDFAARH